MKSLVVIFSLLLVHSCTANKTFKRETANVDAVAYFAGGCFWGVEHYMQQLDGVGEVDSGYMGGRGPSPTYEEISTGKTGYLEAVRVKYHSGKISYHDITQRFFEIHDPTQADGQGPDIGEQYLSAVFVHSESERQIAQSLIDQLVARGYKVVTQLRDVTEGMQFWPAEKGHQNYYEKSGKTPYCHGRVKRFGE